MRRAVGIDAELRIVRQTGADLGGKHCELAFQRRGEISAPFGNAEGGAVGRQSRLALRPWQKLPAVVREAFRALDVDVARLQRAGEVDEHAHLKRAPLVGTGSGPTLGDKMLPSLGGETQVDAVQLQGIATGMAVFAHQRQGVQQAMVLGRRLDFQQVEQPKQQGAVLGVDGPEQWQVVAAMPGGDRLALVRERVGAAPLGQDLPDFAPERGICGVLIPRRLQHLAEHANQGFLEFAVLIVQRLEPLLGRGLRAPDAAQHHLHQFVAAAHACLAQQREQQGVPPGRLGNVEQVADFQRGSFCGELAQLRVRDSFQQGIGIDQAVQPFQAIGPETDRLGRRRPWCLLQAVEPCREAVRRLDQQGLQHRRLFGCEARRDAVVDALMHLGADAAHQPVEGAERRQVDRRRLQHLYGAIDKVGRVAHGLGGGEHGVRNHALGRIVVRCGGQIGPYRGLVAVQRLGSAWPIWNGGRGNSELCRQVCDGAGVNIVRRRKAAEVLARLQQHRQQQAARIAAGVRIDEGQVRLAQCVAGSQFLASQPSARPRVDGAVDRRHGVSGKGCAGMAERGM